MSRTRVRRVSYACTLHIWHPHPELGMSGKSHARLLSHVSDGAPPCNTCPDVFSFQFELAGGLTAVCSSGWVTAAPSAVMERLKQVDSGAFAAETRPTCTSSSSGKSADGRDDDTTRANSPPAARTAQPQMMSHLGVRRVPRQRSRTHRSPVLMKLPGAVESEICSFSELYPPSEIEAPPPTPPYTALPPPTHPPPTPHPPPTHPPTPIISHTRFARPPRVTPRGFCPSHDDLLLLLL